MKPANRLGRGLGALIDTNNVTKTDGGSMINEIDIKFISPNPNQPRTHFDEEELEELAVSIKENGIISPITLRQINDENYQIIAGERRFRASKLAGLTKIPAYIRPANDEQMQVMALIENIQRTDLNAIETALGYSKIISDFGFTQEQLGERLGKKRATITNYLRLLNLPAEIQIGIKDRKIDMGHAKVLAGLNNEVEQLKIYKQVVNQELSVRKTEELVRNLQDENTENLPKQREKKIIPEKHQQYKNEIHNIFNTNINISSEDNGKGKIMISFADEEELIRIMGIFDDLKEKIEQKETEQNG